MKEKFLSKIPTAFTEIHQKFQEHYWLYGSASLAGIAAGVLVVNKLVERPSAAEVQQEPEQIIIEQKTSEEIAA